MPSLSAHLRLPDDHSGLPFHPSCPVCRRDRLAGSLDGELLSRRTQAVIATSLIAFSAVGAPVAAASEPDTVSEGSAEPVDTGDQDSFDIGDDTVVLPEEPTAAPEASVAPAVDGDTAPLESESEVEAVEPIAETPDDVTAAPTPQPVPVPVVEAPPAVTPATETLPPPDTPTVNTTSEEGEIRADVSKRRERPATRATQTTPVAAEPSPVAAPAPSATPTPAALAPTVTRVVASTTTTSTTTASSRAAPGDRFHVVARGESLWSIAGDALGDRASVARIAREVNRLWALNEDSIASGDPDLLFAGTRLRLR